MEHNNTRPTMISWLKAAALRERSGEGVRLDNGKNELDVLAGHATAEEIIQTIQECAVLGQTDPNVRASYEVMFSAAIQEINAADPAKAQEIIEDAKDIGQESPWLWYAASQTSQTLDIA